MSEAQKQEVNALFMRGVSLHQQGQLQKAKLIYEQVLKKENRHFEAMFLLGVVEGQSNRPENAAELFEKAIKINPNHAEAYNNHGNALQEVGKFNESLDSYKRAININPEFALALYNQGNALKKLSRTEEALACYEKAINIEPNYVEAYINLGNLLTETRKFDKALISYERAIQINPNIPDAYLNRGNIFQELNLFEEAIDNYNRAININKEYAPAYSNKGNALFKLKKYEEAVQNYKQAENIQPEVDYLLGTLLNSQMHMCNWEYFEERNNLIQNGIKNNKKIIPPFQVLSLTDNLSDQKKASQIWIEDKFKNIHLRENKLLLSKRKEIVIGYFSGDFREHAVSYLAAELFEVHDKSKFKLIAFSYGPEDNSLLSERIKKAFSKFLIVNSLSDQDIAIMAQKMKIDIAVDLSGLTLHGRPGIFSYRAAPLQISYLGYLGTISNKIYDYIIADKILIPEKNQQYYSEKIIYLPSYQINDTKRIIGKRTFSKEELGLPSNEFVYCSFNNNYKITPKVFDVWMRILNNVPQSVLFLYAENRWVKKNLQNEAEKRGVVKDRLIFAQHIERSEYLARYKVADLFLDTFPYNAGTTASDALWADVPVLTFMGQSFAGRMASSLLAALDMNELITSTIDEYEKVAVEIALMPNKLDYLKSKIKYNKNKKILFDTKSMTRKIEEAFLVVYERNLKNLPCDHIYIS